MENKITTPTENERRIIKFMILLGIFSILNFIYFFFQPENIGDPILFLLLTITILYSIVKKLYMWYNYSNISVPEQPASTPDLKVDILTTYYPGEPYQMTITTLEAINNITYPHTTYLCDEANDPYLKQFCEENGIIHVTRDNRINAKAGNINNALEKHAVGDICVILDPDHIPEPNFLDPILPYFNDPEIAFVQIVQSYYNIKETLVARGAAEQTFQFYGPMMMTLNSYGAVNAIGANCVFRRAALDSIGGHAPGLCEDMHTAMLLYSKGWKAVYLPEVLARGLAPSNLTNFFKQQLKWSRGTFDLLVKVYPKIFNKLTGRQKIHYGILPLHYFGGIISLINFLIPILSLLLATTPWEGNIIDFALVILPVALSSLLIRTFIQKWVIEKNERGFHLVGGLLHINTWWIYIIGLAYTIVNKKVPYLPTPKENEWNTNYKIVIPNIIVALVSIVAIIYGLQKDFTPYSIVMAGFAFFNACIMFFGVYLSNKVTNQNRILRSSLAKTKISYLWKAKQGLRQFANWAFIITRKVALPLLLIILIASMDLKNFNDLYRWERVKAPNERRISKDYIGIFHPRETSGLSDIQEINFLENEFNVNFNIISYYLAWNEESLENFPDKLMEATYEKNAIPMITWEPWVSDLKVSDSIQVLQENQKGLKYIAEGFFDDYIKKFIQKLNSYDRPVFLRFAHEFDNPQYPWSSAGDNTPEDFKAAWKHVSSLIDAEGAEKIVMVWNPWKPGSIAEYYPGDEYVDWIGLTSLHYGPLDNSGLYYSFEELYEPFRQEILNLTNKPVMLSEFGALDLDGTQDKWIENAIESINSQYPEISGIVLFNSAFDKNIPETKYQMEFLDWTSNSLSFVEENFKDQSFSNYISLTELKRSDWLKKPLTAHDIRGVHYKKGKDWKNNYYALTRKVLQTDFELMKEAGINTIHYTGSNIYDYNLIKQASNENLKIIYEFEFNKATDFGNSEDIKKITEDILKKVRNLRDEENIIAFSFKYDLQYLYTKPGLFEEQTAYLNWLQRLILEIKKLDESKSIVLELFLNKYTKNTIRLIKNTLPIDSYGLIVNDTSQLEEVLNLAQQENISVYLSQVNTEVFLKDKKLDTLDLLLQNWQDERSSSHLSFDGLLDFNGNKKHNLATVENRWGEKTSKPGSIEAKILRPAVPLLSGSSVTYNAVLLDGHSWKLALEKIDEIEITWSLIKNDTYGNALAVKELGKGPEISLKVPQEYEKYELLLTVKKNGYTTSSKSSLHTPLVP